MKYKSFYASIEVSNANSSGLCPDHTGRTYRPPASLAAF